MLKVNKMVHPDLKRKRRGRTVNRFSGKREKNRKMVLRRDRRKDTTRRNVIVRWKKNKINSGWCISVRKMSGGINNLLKIKSVRYNIQFGLRG